MNTTRPPSPIPTLPDPGVTETGHVKCNEPLLLATGMIVGYCQRYVKLRRQAGRPPKPHRGPHRIEWWTS